MPTQAPSPQVTVIAAAAQPKLPSHSPVWKQGARTAQSWSGSLPAAWATHAPELHVPHSPQSSSGSVPVGCAVQVPAAAAVAHDSHSPVQRPSQQTPSAQMPLVHMRSAVQAWPRALRSRHTPLTSQKLPTLQSRSVVQRARQALASAHSSSPAQTVVAALRQSPSPSQVVPAVIVPFEQVAALHEVPAVATRQVP